MTDPDRELAGKARSGDRRALERLYERHRARLFGYLVKVTGRRPLAEDVFQEVWIKVMQGIDGYDVRRGTFRAWLMRIASNAAVDRSRREKLRSGPELDAPVDDQGRTGADLLPAPGPGPGREGESGLLRVRLARELASLSDRQRAAVLLRHQQGLSYAELAESLGVAEGTAKTLVHRAVLRLRERLSGWVDG
jgi:RNA polymerase sigma-70 factor (ECF subfamily)